MPDSDPRLMAVFADALERTDPADRAAYLDVACAGDAALRRRIEALLAAHDGAGRFLEPDATDDDLLELDDALDRLANEFPVAAELVKLRFFAGMTLGEAADALSIPRRTADRQWAFARAWLADALAGG